MCQAPALVGFFNNSTADRTAEPSTTKIIWKLVLCDQIKNYWGLVLKESLKVHQNCSPDESTEFSK